MGQSVPVTQDAQMCPELNGNYEHIVGGFLCGSLLFSQDLQLSSIIR